MIHRAATLYIGLVLFVVALQPLAEASSYTESHYWGKNPFARDRNPFRPRTIYGVHKAYRSFVLRSNGVNKQEARIIAQYHLVKEHRQTDFDFRKPRLIQETDAYFAYRFPGKFSMMSKKVNIFIYHVSKADGKILAAYESDLPDDPS